MNSFKKFIYFISVALFFIFLFVFFASSTSAAYKISDYWPKPSLTQSQVKHTDVYSSMFSKHVNSYAEYYTLYDWVEDYSYWDRWYLLINTENGHVFEFADEGSTVGSYLVTGFEQGDTMNIGDTQYCVIGRSIAGGITTCSGENYITLVAHHDSMVVAGKTYIDVIEQREWQPNFWSHSYLAKDIGFIWDYPMTSGVSAPRLLQDFCVTTSGSQTCPVTPVISINSPANGSTVSGTDNISVNVSNSPNVTVSRVEFYAVNSAGSVNHIGTTNANPLDLSWNTTAVPADSYTIVAQAYDAAGGVVLGQAQVSVAITSSPSPPSPSPTLNFDASSASIITSQSSTLSWSSTDATSCSASGDWLGSKSTSGSESVSPTATSTYILTCTGAGGSASKSVTVGISSFIDNQTLSIPANLTADAISASQINLSWSVSTDSIRVAGYNVFRDNVQVATTTLTNYQDVNLSANTTYTYNVSAYDAANNESDKSTAVSAATHPISIEFSLNDRIKTIANVNVRSTPSLSSVLLGVQPQNSLGTIINGPVYADNYFWWQINYDNNPDGWSVENYLEKYIQTINTTSPVISNVSAILITNNNAVISWTTDEPADSSAEYGTTISYDSTIFSSTLKTSHSLNLTNLSPDTTYHFRVKSKDAAGNLAASIDYPIKTQVTLITFVFTKSLYFGLKDNEVAELQKFLAKDKTIYPEGLTTGYFGPLTQKAVQRFQCKYNIVCFGTPYSTGYGSVGPKTRNKLNKSLGLTFNPSISGVDFVKKITILNGSRPEIVATNDRVFVLYRTNSANFSLKIFDADMNNEILSKTLIEKSTSYGMLTDIRVASDGKYLYAFYETADTQVGKTYLFGEKYSLDDSFNKIDSIGPISTSTFFENAVSGDEKLDDPIVLVAENSVFAITRYKYSSEKSGSTKYKVYEFTKELSKKKEFVLDLSSVADGGASQSSAIYHNGYYYMLIATTVGKAGVTDLLTPSDLMIVKLDTSWNIKESKNISTDNSSGTDVEQYITGFKADSDNFYLTYIQIDTKNMDSGGFTAPLKIYDKNFNLVVNEKVKTKQSGEPGLRPSLELRGDAIFVGHDSGKLGKGNAEIYIFKKK